MMISVTIDGSVSETFPKKESAKKISSIECGGETSNGTGSGLSLGMTLQVLLDILDIVLFYQFNSLGVKKIF